MEVEPQVGAREFQNTTIVPLELHKEGEHVEFQLHPRILCSEYDGWSFYSSGDLECRDFIILDMNGNQIQTATWITDRNLLNAELTYWYTGNSHIPVDLCISCRPVKLPAPIAESIVYNYLFYDNNNKRILDIEWRVQGTEKWQKLREDMLPLQNEDTILEFRRYDRGVYSDKVYLPVPWKYDTKLALPFDMESILMGNKIHLKHYADFVHFEQQGRTISNPTELAPDVPFNVFAWHSYIGHTVMKNHGAIVIPTPPHNFNKQNWQKLFGNQEVIEIQTFDVLKETDYEFDDLCCLSLTSKGYASFIRDERTYVGMFNIQSVISEREFEIEIRPFPRWPTSAVDSQHMAPLPLHNRDILKMILKQVPPEEQEKLKAVCKLWAIESKQYPVFHIRREIKMNEADSSPWISSDLYDIDSVLEQ